MSSAYDTYYEREDYFGAPFIDLLRYFKDLPAKGKVLDVGCGQGRNAIPIARLGFEVTGVDISQVGIDQMMKVGAAEELGLKGVVADIHTFDRYAGYDHILFDSMFHFAKKDLQKEVALIDKTIRSAKAGCALIFCIQDTGKKVSILNDTLKKHQDLSSLKDEKMVYHFKDGESGHSSTSNYRLIIVKKSS